MHRWLAAGVLLLGGAANANPFNIGRFGGLEGDPMNTGPFAIYWNPAALSAPGGRIGLHGLGVLRQASYDRPAEEGVPPDEAAANSGLSTLSSGGVVPALAGGYGWLLGDFELGVAGGVYIASAGNTDWEKDLAAPDQHPGAVDGPQRWHSMATTMSIVSPSLGLAAKHRPTGLSLGVAPVLNFARLSTVRARTVDKRRRLNDERGQLAEGRILLEDATDTAVTFVAGLRWDATENLAFAVTWHQGTEYQLEGDAFITFGLAEETIEPARINLPVADVLRVGAAVSPLDWLTLRPSLEWGRWSVMDRQIAINRRDKSELIRIERDFSDTFAFLLRGDFHVLPWLDLQVGGGYELGATPQEAHEPGLAESDHWHAGAGAAFAITDNLRLMGSFVWQQFADVTVTDSSQKPDANGTYTDQRQFFTLDLEVRL